MSRKRGGASGPSPTELKLKADLDRTRRELSRLKKSNALAELAAGSAPVESADEPMPVAAPGDAPLAPVATQAGAEHVPVEAQPGAEHMPVDTQPGAEHESPAPAAVANGAASEAAGTSELGGMAAEIADLRRAKQRLSRLYFNQLEENRKRAQKLHQILENICQINAGFDLATLLQRLADNIRESLGFRVVLIRLREHGSRRLKACAFSGIDPHARERLEAQDVSVDGFMSWLRDEFKVSRSFFISHNHAFSHELPEGHATDLGKREEWEWHQEDVLLVPLFNRNGELLAYFSVDDPADRLVPSREIIELLEIYGNHAVVAIENSRLYQELEQHTRELEQAGQHMQELHALKSNFVSTVSHELRTPLTAIRAYTETLLGAPDGDLPATQLRRFLGIINEESQRLARLIESVLDLNRYESGTAQFTRQPVEARELLEEAVAVLGSVAQAGQVALRVEVECDDARIEANRDQMQQLVLHLGSNAIKFTPPGGAVTLRLLGAGHELTLRVEDTGIGIPEESLDKIFERFYQVDSSLVRRYGGTGLGLAICKSIVEWHGGRIFAESEEGRGSSFTVVLPRRTSPRVQVRPGPKHETGTEDVLKLAIEMVAEVMNARIVSLLSPDETGQLVIRAAIGLEDEVVRNARIKPGLGVAGWVAEHRRPVCVSGRDLPTEVEGSQRSSYHSGTFLSVPLESKGGLLGVLNVTDPLSQKSFDAEDCHLLLHLAERVAAAWDQALGMEQSQASMDDTADALREVLRHLERGRRHSPDRVRLARATARQLGLSESEAGVISFAASVHDVGMRRIGERVVESAGALSREDRAELERHPELGAELLRPLESMGVVRDIILSHHEWWDGSGYPRGVSGDEIPIGGRILAVVDAYESMTIGRTHRSAVPRSEALLDLDRLKGTQFDPAAVEAFGRALEEVEITRDSGAERLGSPSPARR